MAPALPLPPGLMALGLAAGAYLLGSVPFALLIGRMHGVDIRQHGSGNVGATNVVRVLGRGPGILCFVLDFLKGVLPVATGLVFGLPLWGVLLAAAATILGHSRSVFLKFKGGKSVATGAGTIVAMAPLAGLGALLVWGGVFSVSRIVSLASITAALSLPVLTLLTRQPLEVVGFSAAAACYVVIRHRDNIRRLREGNEPRMERKK
ncbi:Glycerol-3-phosphate acyltransferase [compost metagenome]